MKLYSEILGATCNRLMLSRFISKKLIEKGISLVLANERHLGQREFGNRLPFHPHILHLTL
jgi:hypothetical protein